MLIFATLPKIELEQMEKRIANQELEALEKQKKLEEALELEKHKSFLHKFFGS